MNLAYYFYETARMMTAPARIMADASRHSLQNPANPFAYSPYAKSIAAGCEMFERVTRRYSKPSFGFTGTIVDGVTVPIRERVVWEKPLRHAPARHRRSAAAGSSGLHHRLG